MNGDFAYKIEPNLTIEDRNKLYEWLINYVWKGVSDKAYFKQDLQLAYFIFDKKKFYQYIDEVKLLRNNVKYQSDKGKDIIKTNRIEEIKPILEYLRNKSKYDKTFFYNTFDNVEEFKKVLLYFINGIKLYKEEINYIMNELHKQSQYTDETENINKINKIIDDLFKEKIKESIITNYNYFIIKKSC